LAPHRSSEFLAVLFGSGAGDPVAHHPAKVSSSSAAVPHRCGLLPSCRSSPLAPWTFVRCTRKLRSDRSLHECRFGWAARPPPRLSVAAFLPLPATFGGCRSTGIGSVPVSRPALDLRFRTPTLVPLAGSGSWGSLRSLAGTPRLRRNLAAFAVRSCSTSVRAPLAVSGSRCATEDSLARWLSGPPEILGIPGGSVVPSPSVDTRPAFLPSVSAGRLQGLAPPTSPGRSAGLATHGPPVPSLGLFPLRGSTRPTDGGSLRFLRPPPGLPSGHPGPGFHSARLR
jgi:hypothetical protein